MYHQMHKLSRLIMTINILTDRMLSTSSIPIKISNSNLLQDRQTNLRSTRPHLSDSKYQLDPLLQVTMMPSPLLTLDMEGEQIYLLLLNTLR
jgi:hypothetical protein